MIWIEFCELVLERRGQRRRWNETKSSWQLRDLRSKSTNRTRENQNNKGKVRVSQSELVLETSSVKRYCDKWDIMCFIY